MDYSHAKRRVTAVIILLVVMCIAVLNNPDFYQPQTKPPEVTGIEQPRGALAALETITVKGRASKTGYSRDLFGDGWESYEGCDVRNLILKRDLSSTVINDKCQVVTGTLNDPYTAKTIQFSRGELSSQAVQIDHVVALSDAWQKGAQQLSPEERISFSNDPLELLAVDGETNQQKSDSDAATWLPPNKAFRCQYVARQIAVKIKYRLWVTVGEKEAMIRVLSACPVQQLPTAQAGLVYNNPVTHEEFIRFYDHV